MVVRVPGVGVLLGERQAAQESELRALVMKGAGGGRALLAQICISGKSVQGRGWLGGVQWMVNSLIPNQPKGGGDRLQFEEVVPRTSIAAEVAVVVLVAVIEAVAVPVVVEVVVVAAEIAVAVVVVIVAVVRAVVAAVVVAILPQCHCLY